jgi:hypothetical protein
MVATMTASKIKLSPMNAAFHRIAYGNTEACEVAMQ